MASDRIVGIDLGTTNSLVAFMQGGRPVVIRVGESPIMKRAKILEVEKMLDGEPSSWDERYPIQRGLEDEICKARKELSRCDDGDIAAGLMERAQVLENELKRIKNL
jgi:hypothetical protein